MDQSILSSRAIMGMYFARLEADPGMAWVNGVSNLFTSDQESETYAWMGMSPSRTSSQMCCSCLPSVSAS